MYEMNKITDKIFGEMEYKYSWTKKEDIVLFEKKYRVNVIAQAYTGDEISDIQRKNYKNYKKFLSQYEKDIKEKLINYCKEICENKNIILYECVKPISLIFERDNSWGILFDTDCDVENGIGLYIVNDKIEVGSQDILL